MVEVSDNYAQLSLEPGRRVYCKIELGNITYYDDRILGFELRDIAHKDWFTIGEANPNEFVFTIKYLNTVELGCDVRPRISFDGIEWITLGKFRVTRRYVRGKYAKIFCHDKLYSLKYPPETISDPDWERADTLLAGLCAEAGLLFVGRCEPFATFRPSGEHSISELIGYIAGLHGACAIINRFGSLEFRGFREMPVTELDETNVFSKKIHLTRAGVKGLRVDTGNGTIIAGSGLGLSQVDVYDPFMTQEIADSIIDSLSDMYFYGAEIEMQGVPFLEAGDMMKFVDTDGMTTPIMISEIYYKYDGGFTAKIYSKNKYNSDPVIHRQDFEDRIARLREEMEALSGR